MDRQPPDKKNVQPSQSTPRKADALSVGPDPSRTARFHGLKWTRSIWDSIALWTVEPDMNTILSTVSEALGADFPPQPSTIEFLAQGALNKIYLIQAGDREFVARVTLPVDPEWKTLSEVGTLDWIRDNTSLPVPDILFYQHTRNNPINFEWMLMTRVPGSPLDDMWLRMSEKSKSALVLRVAKYCAETFQHMMRGIGNLYLPFFEGQALYDPMFAGYLVRPRQGSPRLYSVQRIVSGPFFTEDRIHDTIFRGPFFSSADWLSTKLTLVENECQRHIIRIKKVLANRGGELYKRTKKPSEGSDSGSNDKDLDDEGLDDEDLDESDLDGQDRILSIITRLRSRIQDFFPPNNADVVTGPEPSMLFHHDLSMQNILVNDKGNLTGVVDWECVSVLPLWAACDLPAFLESKVLDKEPLRADYNLGEDSELQGNEDAELYLENLRNYDLTRLRQLFLGEMRKIAPRWVEIYESSQRQRDFDLAVSSCDDELFMRRIENWLNDMDAGVVNMRGLQQRIDEGTL